MNKKLKIFLPAMIIAVVVGRLVLFNRPSQTPPHTESVIPLEDMSDQNKADSLIISFSVNIY